MNRPTCFRPGVVLLIALTLSMSLLTSAAMAGEIVMPEPHWQLFLDNHVITRSTGFQRVLHQPEPRGIVLEGTEDWEQRGVTPLYVGFRKDGRLECYYRAHGPYGPFTCYAVSKDGINWEKPILGQVETPAGKDNNVVACSQPMDLERYGNVRDSAKRFAICVGPRRRTPVYFNSEPPDIMNDPGWLDKFVASGGVKPGLYHTLDFWDDIHHEWVAMRQAPNHPPVRCVGRYASATDLKSWTSTTFFTPMRKIPRTHGTWTKSMG